MTATEGSATPPAGSPAGGSPEPEHIGTHAAREPDRPAVVAAATGAVTTFGQLDLRSRRLAAYLVARGLGVGDTVAVVLDNTPRYFEVAWGAQRAGLYWVPVNWHLTPGEAAYIVADAGAGGLVVSADLTSVAEQALDELVAPAVRLVVHSDRPTAADAVRPAPVAGDGHGGSAGTGESGRSDAVAFEAVVDDPGTGGVSVDPAASPEIDGSVMLYSSGTTGRPKGIRRPIPGLPFGRGSFIDLLLRHRYGFGPDTVYLSPAPLYHAAPLGWSMAAQRLGGTVVVMERFDPEELLAAIPRYGVTHVQMVPTMFVRLLKLPEEVRQAADLRTIRALIHAAAPCPVEVKHQMLDWWGPLVHEYYAGSEGNGFCAIGPEEWLEHPGSVGRPLFGEIHIVGDDGRELPPGEVGTIYFGGMPPFEYHNDPEKTRQAFDERGWSTLGDLGHVDEEGYLYLSDRRTNLIISGGVNIYPREVEDVLVLHPAVADVAVVGEPDPDFGQQVVAVVELADPAAAGPELEHTLIEHCRAQLSHFKCPKRVIFDEPLPRTPTGKLAKRLLIDRLWPSRTD